MDQLAIAGEGEGWGGGGGGRDEAEQAGGAVTSMKYFKKPVKELPDG